MNASQGLQAVLRRAAVTAVAGMCTVAACVCAAAHSVPPVEVTLPSHAAASATALSGWPLFESHWRAAMASGEPAAIAALTRLPFLYEGRSLGRAGFLQAVPMLFDAGTRRCLAGAPVVREPAEPGVRVMFCPPHSFYFDADGGAWRLREFGRDMP